MQLEQMQEQIIKEINGLHSDIQNGKENLDLQLAQLSDNRK